MNAISCPRCETMVMLSDAALDMHLELHDDKVSCSSCGLLWDPEDPPDFSKEKGSDELTFSDVRMTDDQPAD